MSTNEEDASSTSDSLQRLLGIVGEEVIYKYRQKYLAPALLKACPKMYSVENAVNWVNLKKFAWFVADLAQNGFEFHHHTPSKNPSICSESEPSSPFEENQITPSKRSRSQSSSIPSIDSPTTRLSGQKTVTVELLENPPRKRQKRAEEVGRISITRELSVHEVKILTEPPETWITPFSEEKTIAYILDLSNSQFEYENEKGELITMSGIIKSLCTDGWEGGSGGSRQHPVKVHVLDNMPCMRARHQCRGAFLCSESDPKLWEDYQRSENDFAQPDQNNSCERGTPLEIAAAFYHSVKYLECHANGGCNGHPVLRKLQEISAQGKNFVVGCSAWNSEDQKSEHIYREIPLTVQEDILAELFATGSQTTLTSIKAEEYTGPCDFMVAPYIGFRQKHCPHVHFRDKQQIAGTIKRRECPAGIIIFIPMDRSVRKAVVVPLAGAHNHPPFKSDKPTVPARNRAG